MRAHFLLLIFCRICSANFDPRKSLVWGPGISAIDFNLPVRYAFLQLCNANDSNVTSSLPGVSIRLTLEREVDSSHCQVRTQAIDRRDGSYILRYRVLGPCPMAVARVFVDGAEVDAGPFRLHNPVCPDHVAGAADAGHFSTALGCGAVESQIIHDLRHWPSNSIDFDEVLSAARRRWASHPGAYSFCHYAIKDNEVYRECFGEHVGFSMFSDATLLSLTRKVRLPDTQFLLNLGDWPLQRIAKGREDVVIPILSWCGSSESLDIVLPTYDLMESTLEMMGRQTLDVQSVVGMSKWAWDEKEDVAFWRGRDSSRERLQLVQLSRAKPHLIQAHITRFFFFDPNPELYGETEPSIPFGDFFQFRYLISLDGTVAAYRLPYLLAGNSVVMKQASVYYEHFYGQLQPFVHFIPLLRNLSDVEEKIRWARENPSKVADIIRNANVFVSAHLQPHNLFCYHMHALQEYTTRLKSRNIDLTTSLSHIRQPNSMHANCKSTENRHIEL